MHRYQSFYSLLAGEMFSEHYAGTSVPKFAMYSLSNVSLFSVVGTFAGCPLKRELACTFPTSLSSLSNCIQPIHCLQCFKPAHWPSVSHCFSNIPLRVVIKHLSPLGFFLNTWILDYSYWWSSCISSPIISLFKVFITCSSAKKGSQNCLHKSNKNKAGSAQSIWICLLWFLQRNSLKWWKFLPLFLLQYVNFITYMACFHHALFCDWS